MSAAQKKLYSLSKSRGILKSVYAWYKRKGNKLPIGQLDHLETHMASLDQALLHKNREEASQQAKELELFSDKHCKKSILEYAWELGVALLVALVIATIVRQMWFELYEIPTGSMRPTFREQDHLTVTKTAFGINYPLETKHLYFDPNLVQRTSILIFSGDKLPLPDVDTTYFGIFPYKKRYIKRLIGKPGDSIYFYGGRLYGVDKEGNDISELRESPWMQSLEHIPFLSFEGSPARGNDGSVFLRHMHIPYGKLTSFGINQVAGEVFDGTSWVKDQPLAQTTPHTTIQTYSDVFGMRNFAEARLLTKEELKQLSLDQDVPEGVLYLQLHHTPSLTYPKPVNGQGNYAVIGYTAILPLQQHHLDELMNHLYTARFVVSDGKGRNYSLSNKRTRLDQADMSGVPDGTYEFYSGKASQINWGGIESKVLADSPLYSHDPKNIQKFYNLGIEMSTYLMPSPRNESHFPNRYAYFRDGDLYLLGAPILKKDDPTLKAFNESEMKKQSQSTPKAPYVAFKDYGAPLKDGKIDVDFIRTFGVKVPDQQYLVLGDNHAMSSDSRIFGFVPQNNLQGAPSLIIWPPGERLGDPSQKPYPFMNLPRAIVWAIAGLGGVIWYLIHQYRQRQPIFAKKVKRA
jgi:signal peptidase I